MQAPGGIKLPFPWINVRGDRVSISGHGPQNTDGSLAGPFGKVGAEVTLEQGLLGLAFHPLYESNGRFFVFYTRSGGDVVVAITDGKLDFGPWEQIFYGEFDGRRPKRVLVKIIGE